MDARDLGCGDVPEMTGDAELFFVAVVFFRSVLDEEIAKAGTRVLERWLDDLGCSDVWGRMTVDATGHPSLKRKLDQVRRCFLRDQQQGVVEHFLELVGLSDDGGSFSFISSIVPPVDREVDWGRLSTTNSLELRYPRPFVENVGLDGVADRLRDLAAALPIDSGLGGWALAAEDDDCEEAGQVARQLPGLLLAGEYPTQSMGGRICGVSWLTVVGPSLLSELGGPPQLGPGIQVEAVGGRGAHLVQAGPRPRLAPPLEEVTAVSRWLAPVTCWATPPGLWLFLPRPEDQQAWVHRLQR